MSKIENFSYKLLELPFGVLASLIIIFAVVLGSIISLIQIFTGIPIYPILILSGFIWCLGYTLMYFIKGNK